MKYALIGCGRISPNHIAAAKANHLEMVGICDIDEEVLNDKAEKFDLGDVRRYTDYREMLREEKPELVAIATESGRHAAIALDCIEAGCSLIIEKPIALSLADADAVINAAKERGVKVCACHQNRFNKSIGKIREALETGRFGRMFYGTAHVRWCRDYEYYSKAKWRGTWEQDGGALMNQCIHNIDLLRWMMGDEIDQVVGMTDRLNHDYIEAEDMGIALVKFKNGSYGIIEGTTDLYPKNLEETLYLFGEKGTVKAGGQSVNRIEEWRFGDTLDDPEEVKREFGENPPNVYGYGHTPLYADMIDAIENDREPYVDGEAGRRALELVLAVYKSAAEGKSVKLPLEECSTMDFKGRFGDRKEKIFVHPTSIVDDDVEIGEGTKIWHFCHIQSGARIGRNCSFGQNVNVSNNAVIGNGVKVQNNVSVYEGVELEDYVFCGPSCVFTNDLTPRARYPKGHKYKKTVIRHDATLGANCTILCGHTVGEFATVAAGAVVTRDVEPHALVAGVPARRIGWVCECGQVLDENLICPECGREYQMGGRQEIKVNSKEKNVISKMY